MSDTTFPPGPPESGDETPPFQPDYDLIAYLEEPQGSARREYEQLTPIRRFFLRVFGF